MPNVTVLDCIRRMGSESISSRQKVVTEWHWLLTFLRYGAFKRSIEADLQLAVNCIYFYFGRIFGGGTAANSLLPT